MAATKLRIKFGEHEFDAQGPVDVLREHFQLFLRLVAPQAEKALAAFPVADDTSPLRKILRMRGRIAYVTVPAKTDDLVLLLMHGHKVFRKNNSVSGADIMDGLRASGAPVRRADKILREHAGKGMIAWAGSGRKRRYSLKRAGVTRAQQVARQLVKLLEK